MDKDLLQTIIIAGVVLALGIPLLRLMFKGRVKSISASRDGLKMDLDAEEKIDRRDEIKHYMDKRIEAVDRDLYLEAKDLAQDLWLPITRAIQSAGLCTPALVALAANLRGPIYRATEENDFKNKLSGLNRQKYLEGKLDALANEYSARVEESAGDPCAAGAAPVIRYPAWSDIRDSMVRMLDTWATSVADKVVAACRKKIDIYAEYRGLFEDAGDARYVKIVDECTAKNASYIKALGGEA